MKVYFTVSPRALIKDKYRLYEIYDIIQEFGCRHISDFVKTINPTEFYNLDEQAVAKIYSKFISYIRQADVVVFDVTVQSMEVGQQLAYSLSLGKPTICLHEKGNKPVLISGVGDTKLVIAEYDNNNLRDVVRDAIEDAAARSDVRFNFFISPKIGAYLSWVTKNKRIPRAVFLRGLLDEAMSRDDEYQGDVGPV